MPYCIVEQRIHAYELNTLFAVRVVELTFEGIYREFLPQVLKWARALGGPTSELEDIAHEVFLVVRRRLADFDGENPAGWLYRITGRSVRDHRRKAWFRKIMSRRGEPDELDGIVAVDRPIDELLEARRVSRTVEKLLDGMNVKRRVAFVLFEVEGLSGEEIATLEGIPVGTVWRRLHQARKEFVALVSAAREKGEL